MPSEGIRDAAGDKTGDSRMPQTASDIMEWSAADDELPDEAALGIFNFDKDYSLSDDTTELGDSWEGHEQHFLGIFCTILQDNLKLRQKKENSRSLNSSFHWCLRSANDVVRREKELLSTNI